MPKLVTEKDRSTDRAASPGRVRARAGVAVPAATGDVPKAPVGARGRHRGARGVGESKYRNTKTEVGGITFDSKAEARRWCELKLLERAGQIAHLQRQAVYVLAPSVKFDGSKRAQPALKLIVDFSYMEAGRLVLEDVKGVITTAFTIKRHLLKAQHGLDVRLTQ